MRFGPVPLDQAEGAILAHSENVGGQVIRKGHVLDAGDLDQFRRAGVAALVVARLEPGDVAEDAAAAALAAAIVPDEAAAGLQRTLAHTGRVNLKATGPGVLVLDVAAVQALNLIDPAITLATLPPFARVSAGTMVATIKIISYAVAGPLLDAARRVAAAAILGAVRVAPVVVRSAGLLLTEVPGQRAVLNSKGREAVVKRLRALGMALDEVRVVPHEVAAMAVALAAMPGGVLLILTGSATSDLHDTGPEAVRAAGGQVARFGMPVDPGNLLFHGTLGGRPVIGLPGCARSPALNGADWVLERLVCGLEVTGADVAAMGVGGLLKEIAVRGQPREG